MTYTIVARSPDTGQLGVAIATYSLGVGGYCPFLERGLAAMSTQAFANPRLGPEALDALRQGASPEKAMARLADADPGFAYRQVAIVGMDGPIAMHTGPDCRAWAGHAVGADFAAFGNVLAGEHTVAAIAERWRQSADLSFDARLLSALEAGRDAGGQAGGDGAHLPERSAALTVQGADIVDDIDLRVDAHDDAVTELRRVHGLYAPYLDYYRLRARAPEDTPPQDVWARDVLGET